MAHFLKIPRLDVNSNGQWVLKDTLAYQSDHLVTLIVVPKGFETDLASIPWVFRFLIPKNGRYDAPAIVHDYLYRRTGMKRKLADKIFAEAMMVVNVVTWRRNLMNTGLWIYYWWPFK